MKESRSNVDLTPEVLMTQDKVKLAKIEAEFK